MADDLMFPIGFDLEAAVNDTIKKWNSGQADRLEKALQKRALEIKLKLNTKSLDNLDDVKKRLAQLKIEPITPETKAAIKELAIELKQLAKALEQVQKYSKTTQLGQQNFRNDVQMEKLRQANERLEIQKRRVALAEQKHADAMQRSAERSKQLGNEYQKQSSYLNNLLKKTAALWSLHQVQSFLTNVREVTAQFELQRISLGAILQDQDKANQLFSEIKAFALKSSVKILDLTKYTKQLAAYKIGYDELFETTKKLTDVSVGLGVSMDRVVLAYGQVRATGYLRACLGKGTPVKMYDGSYKVVEDIVPGDLLMGDDEKPRQVGKLHRGVQQMYRVSYKGGDFRCNEHHILTLYNSGSEKIEDIFVFDYLKRPSLYKGVKRISGKYEYFDISVEKDIIDSYYGFSIDGNHRFIIQDNIVTHNTEVRQFTEMGVPIVEELAEKLSKLNGEAVTAADVMELISKRGISFEMVKDVFNDMTSAGGIFYNMQEKQGNTLYGMWAKLGDAASVMYEQIGNTGPVNSAMKGMIQLATDMMRNWKLVGRELAVVAVGYGIYRVATALSTVNTKAAEKATNSLSVAKQRLRTATAAETVAMNNLTAAHTRANAVKKFSATWSVRAAQASIKASVAYRAATMSTNAWTAASLRLYGALQSLKAAFMSNWLTIAITALAALATWAYSAYEKAHKLDNAIADIQAETTVLQGQQTRNFVALADAALGAATGSKQQRDALEELKRTYRDIIPEEQLTLENLKKLKEQGYEPATQAINEYIAAQQKQKAISAIQEEYTARMTSASKEARNIMKDMGLSDTEIDKFFVHFDKVAADSSKTIQQKFEQAAKNAGVKLPKYFFADNKLFTKSGALGEYETRLGAQLKDYNDALETQAERIKTISDEYSKLEGNLGKFVNMQKRVADKVANSRYIWKGGGAIDKDKYGDVIDAMKLNEWVKAQATEIQNNEDIKKAFAYMGEGIKSEWFNIINVLNSNDLGKVSQINFDAIIAAVDKMIAKLDNKNPEILAILNTFRNYLVAQKKEYENMVPSKAVVVRWQTTWRQIVKELKISGQNMNQYLMGSAEDFEEYRKRIKDEVAKVIKTIALLQDAITKNKKTGKRTKEQQAQDEKELKQAQERKVALEKLLAELDKIDIETGKKKKGSKSDTRLQVLQEVAQTLATINKEYDDLAKKEGASKALADIKERFKEVLAYTNKIGGKFELNFGLPTEFKTLQEYRNEILKVMQTLKGLPKGSEKTILDFKTMIGKADSDYLQKQIEAQLKELADRISRTKTAREFYDKVLNLTGDNRLASKVAESIFGQNGSELRKALADQVRGMTGDIPLPDDIISADNIIDYKALRGFAEANKTELGKMYDELVKISDNGQRDLAKTYEGYLKDLEKAKTYSDKRIELARYTANKIAEIEASTLPQEEKERLTAGYQERETLKRGEIEWEAFKDMPIYVQMFDDLDNASTTVLSNMKDKLLELQSVWGASLNPTQLKELQSRLNEIDAQLVKKNPFKTLSDAMKEYRSLSKTGTQADAERGLTEATNRQIAAQQKLNIALNVSRTAQDKYNDAVSEYGADSEQAKNAKMLWDAAEQGVDDASKLVEQTGLSAKEAQRLVEAWKKVKDAIGLSLGEVFQIAHSLGDLAGGIGKLTEVFGGSEEDVQYWNDIANGLNEVTSGIENMVQASISGNPIGIVTSAITAIPNMISGFSNLFSAGKVKRANKEIKKQQNLLEQLEYTYERLEHSSDKLFGQDYIDNYNKRLENLQMQAVSYQKMYEAEKSKGKKKDKQKLKEYEKAYQDTMDEIADMQNELVAKFTGSTRSDIARQMAQSWIDARASMSDTFAAIKGDYQDLIKNMIVEGAAARVIENALSLMWDNMDKMLADNDIDGAIDALVGGVDSALNAANNGMETLWQALEAKGYDMKKLLSDTDTSEYTGIAKSVSSATSEEINANTAALNTQNYYISHIDENVAAMYMLMRAGMGGETQVTASAGWTDWQQQAMDSYLAIQRNTADTVVECRRAANACEEAVDKMSRVIKVKGATQGFNVFLNS